MIKCAYEMLSKNATKLVDWFEGNSAITKMPRFEQPLTDIMYSGPISNLTLLRIALNEAIEMGWIIRQHNNMFTLSIESDALPTYSSDPPFDKLPEVPFAVPES